MMDVIDELIAYCEAWEPWARVMGNVCAGDAAQALRNLRAELAECKRDAERYRFLRAHWDHLATNTCYENGEYHVIAIDLLEQRNIPLNLETLDAEIDAALAAKGEGK